MIFGSYTTLFKKEYIFYYSTDTKTLLSFSLHQCAIFQLDAKYKTDASEIWDFIKQIERTQLIRTYSRQE